MADKKAAKEFVKRWRSILAEVPAGKNNEQQDTQKFWIDLLVNVLGVPAASVTVLAISSVMVCLPSLECPFSMS